jgi:hypothetical protein
MDSNFQQTVGKILSKNQARLEEINKNLKGKGALITELDRLSLAILPQLMQRYFKLAPAYYSETKAARYNEQNKRWEPVAQGWRAKFAAWFRNIVDSVSCRHRKIMLAKKFAKQCCDVSEMSNLEALSAENQAMDTQGGRLGLLFAYAAAGLANQNLTPRVSLLAQQQEAANDAQLEKQQRQLREDIKTKLKLDLSI